MKPPSVPRLTTPARRWRVLYLFLLPLALFALAHLPGDSLPAWVPFATSCGAITGLPCIFCGTTRAITHLLHGEFALAVYYNWLAIPILATAGTLYLLHAVELLTARDLLSLLPRPRLTRRSGAALTAGFVLLWCFQVFLAVSQHKTELLNPLGPLYSLVVQ